MRIRAALFIGILTASFAAAQTATTVSLSGNMTIVIDLGGNSATSTISGSGALGGFGAVTATANGSVVTSDCVSIAGGSISLGPIGVAPATFKLDFGNGNTMNGNLNMPCTALVTALNSSTLPSSGSGTGSVSVTSGTGKYAGVTGSFPAATMKLTITSVDNNTFTLFCSAEITGNGVITVPGGTSQSTAPVSATPAFGAAGSQSIQFTYTDPRGAADLDVVNVLINNFLDGRNACYLAYSRAANVLYLVADNGGTLLGLPLNGTGSVSNSQCTVTGAGSSASASGNNLVLTLNLSFTNAFAGFRILYMAARDLQGGNSGWQALGVWGVPGQVTFPSVSSATPARNTGTSETLAVTINDSKGAQDLGVVNVLINSFLDGRNACYIAYSQPSKVLYLVGDAGGGLSSGLALSGAGSVSNSQCTINAAGSSAVASGSSLTLTLNITFKNAFTGNRVVYAAARDGSEANNSGWHALATATVQ